MKKNPHVNWMGMVTFIACMVAAAGFLIFVSIFQPGPVDVQYVPPVGLTPEQYFERKEAWIKSSAEAIVRGEKAYKLNCSFFYEVNGQDPFLEMFKTGKLPNRGTELEIFRMISKGNTDATEGPIVMKLDHIQEDERWDIVHYLRSLNPGLPSTTRSEWKDFFEKGA